MNILSLPPFVRQFLFEALQGALFAVVALNLAIPGSLSELKSQALIVALAVIRVVAGVATRTIPAFLAYVLSSLRLPTAVEPMEVFPVESGADAPEDFPA